MSSIKILIISTYFPPMPSVASLRVYSFAKYWARMGNDVTVLTTNKVKQSDYDFNLPHDFFRVLEIPYVSIANETYRILKRFRVRIQDQPLNNLERDCTSIDTANMFLKLKPLINKLRTKYGLFTTARIPDDNDTWIWPAVNEGRKLLNSNKFDWIFSSYGPPASHIVAGILSKRYKIKWVADYRDLWIEGHIYPGIWPFTILEKRLEAKYVGNYADMLTTVSMPLAKTLKSKFSMPVHVIQNGYDEEDYIKTPPPYFKHAKKRIVYTGTIYAGKQDPSPLFAAIALLVKNGNIPKNRLYDFEILFFGSPKDWLNSLIHKYKVEPWVKQMGSVSRDDVLSITKESDMLLFLEWEDKLMDGILTSKIFEYFATRKPILGVGSTENTSSGALMIKAGVGIAVGHDIQKIASIIENFLNSNKIAFQIHPNDKIINMFTRKKQAEKLLHLMR